jgi:hypothetical protein
MVETETANVAQNATRNDETLAPSVEHMLDMQRPAIQAMADLSGKLYEGIAAVNKEWTSFVNRRLVEDMAIPERLAACTTMQEMMRVYANYVQNAYSHYQSEFEQLTKLNRSIAQDAMTTLQSHMERAAQNRT